MSNLADAGRLAVDQKAMDRPRRIWTTDEIEALFALPFNDLLFRAQQAHRERHDPNAVQVSTLYGTQLDTVPADFGVELTMENIYLASPQFTDLSIVWRARCFVANCVCGTATHAICALHRIQPDAAKSPNCDEARYRAAPERNSRKTTKLRESQSGRDC